MKGKDLLSISDLSSGYIDYLIDSAIDLKARGWVTPLANKILALVFEKPSLRTRVSFEVAMLQLGGHCIYLSPAEVGLGKREPASDVARVLSRYVNAIAARTYSHKTVEQLGEYADVPVINALSDMEHPCQALTDMMTIREHKGALEGVTLAYVGDGNNVAVSLLLASCLCGIHFRIASPTGYTIPDNFLSTSQSYANDNACEISCTEDPKIAVAGADVVYTDVWTSMGQEAETEIRRKAFAGYEITPELMSLAKDDAIFMHPLPAHRGEEVAEEVVESPQSVVFDQAENRLHMQKAILMHILGGIGTPLRHAR